MPNISKITLPSGTTYDIKDAVARATAGGGIQFRGVTSTTIVDESTATTYLIGTTTHTAENADMVVFGTKEFLYTTADNKWHELGDNTSLGALAYKNSASTTYKPAGTVSLGTTVNRSASVTGSSVSSGDTADYTPAGTITLGTTVNRSSSVTTAATGTTTYRPGGTISTFAVNLSTAGSTAKINNPTKKTVMTTLATAAPNTTAPSNPITYYSVDTNTETLSLYQIGYNTGDSISVSTVSVKTSDGEYAPTTPTFTGDAVRLVTGTIAVPTGATFSGTGTKLTTGSIPVPTGATFSGTNTTLTVT